MRNVKPGTACLALPRCVFEVKRNGKGNGTFWFNPTEKLLRDHPFLAEEKGMFKRDDGNYMDRLEAIAAANQIWAKVSGKAAPAPAIVSKDTRTVEAMVAWYLDTPFFKNMKPNSQGAYRTAINNMLGKDINGNEILKGLIVPELTAGQLDLIAANLIANGSLSRHSVDRILSILSVICGRALKFPAQWGLQYNPVRDADAVLNVSETGRKNPWLHDDAIAVVMAADWIGWPCQGDATLMGIASGCDPQDIVAMPRWALSPESDYALYELLPRGKTDRKTGAWPLVPQLPFMVQRLAEMDARNDALGAPATHQLICTRTKLPYESRDRMTRIHRAIRHLAAGDLETFNALNYTKGGTNNLHLVAAPITSLDGAPFKARPTILSGRKQRTYHDFRSTSMNEYRRVAGRDVSEYITCHSDGANKIAKTFYDAVETIRLEIIESKAIHAFPKINAAFVRERLKVVANA